VDATSEKTAVEREIAIAASPETIWEFLVDERKAALWMGQACSFDPRPGGEYRCEVIPGNTAVGEFVVLDEPRRLVFTWGWESGSASKVAPGSTTIEIELVPEGDGTRLRFTHRDLPGGEAAERHAHGWDHYLERLAIAACGDDPGRDPWLDGGM
jgi:uncharacterized protein YndB with AHSA1/START domain